MIMKETYLDTYKGLKVNSSKSRKLATFKVILDRIHREMSALQSYHSRITVVRLDLHFPDGHAHDNKLENSIVSRYIRIIKADLGSKNWGRHKRFIHGWVKEIGFSRKPHYHLFVGFQALQRTLGAISGDGNTGLWGLLERRWKELTGGSVHFSKYHRIERTNPETFAACFYHLSYLAKSRDKQFNTGESYRRFSFSSLRSKTNDTALEAFFTEPTAIQAAC